MYGGKQVTAIVLAAGAGNRFGGDIPKQFIRLNDSTVLERAISAFECHKYVDKILVTLSQDYLSLEEDLKRKFKKVSAVVLGGSTRQESVKNALRLVDTPFTLVHDSARPYVSQDVISRIVEGMGETLACVPVVSVKDTIRTEEGTLDRSALKSVQTPQGFDTMLLKEAYLKAEADKFTGTDDASLVERLGMKINMVEGSEDNIKITVSSDMREDIRVGFGYDVHRLLEGRKLILLGVEIPSPVGLFGHSDADCPTHALMDAILGAAGLGDIGRLFPDTDPKYEGISSLKLLKEVNDLVNAKGYAVSNVDITVICEKPKISVYEKEMKKNISTVLRIAEDRVNIKGTTEEKLGFTGRGEGIASQAVAVIKSK